MTAAPLRRRSLLDLVEGLRAWHWLGGAAAILVLDYVTGPSIQFPILFILPVLMSTAAHGRVTGALVAVLLPLARMLFLLPWQVPLGWLEAADTGVDVAILLGFVMLVDRLLRQQREIQLLKGLLPICSFCKRIREEDGHWRQLETYIAERSDARFSHTFCPECGRTHYPGMVD